MKTAFHVGIWRFAFVFLSLCWNATLGSPTANIQARACNDACQDWKLHESKPKPTRLPTEGEIWLTHWQTTQLCVPNGECIQTSGGSIQLFQINGDKFPVGASLTVGIYKSPNKPLWEATVTARIWPGFDGGSFGIHAQGPYAIDCIAFPGASLRAPTTAYVTVRNNGNGRSAAGINVQVNCHFDL